MNRKGTLKVNGELLELHRPAMFKRFGTVIMGEHVTLNRKTGEFRQWLDLEGEKRLDLIAGTCNLLAAPLGTPAALVEPIAKAVSRVMEKPAVVERLLQQGIQPISNSNPAQARAYVTSEVARWSAVVKKLGIAL